MGSLLGLLGQRGFDTLAQRPKYVRYAGFFFAGRNATSEKLS